MNRNLASLGLVGAMGLAVAGCGTMGKVLQVAGTINGGALGKGMKAAGMAMSAADTLNDIYQGSNYESTPPLVPQNPDYADYNKGSISWNVHESNVPDIAPRLEETNISREARNEASLENEVKVLAGIFGLEKGATPRIIFTLDHAKSIDVTYFDDASFVWSINDQRILEGVGIRGGFYNLTKPGIYDLSVRISTPIGEEFFAEKELNYRGK